MNIMFVMVFVIIIVQVKAHVSWFILNVTGRPSHFSEFINKANVTMTPSHFCVLRVKISAATVSISRNITDFQNTNGKEIECWFTGRIASIVFLTKNKSSNTFEAIAYSNDNYNQDLTLTEFGKNIFNNVTTSSKSGSKSILFNGLGCLHVREYQCQIWISKIGGGYKSIESTVMSITIKASLSSEVRINGNITAEAYRNGTLLNCSFNLRNGDSFGSIALAAENLTSGKFQDIVGSLGNDDIIVTPFGINLLGNETTVLVVEKTTNSFIITFSYVMCIHERYYKCNLGVRRSGSFTPIRIESNVISVSVKMPPMKPDNISLLSHQVITDGDNVTFVCSGYVGRPPELFTFQKYRQENILSMNYTATKTTMQAFPDDCTYYRKSYFTLHVNAEDKQAIIRCVVESTTSSMTLYADSEPLDVYYHEVESSTNAGNHEMELSTNFGNHEVELSTNSGMEPSTNTGNVFDVGIVCGSIIVVIVAILLFVIHRTRNKCCLSGCQNERPVGNNNSTPQGHSPLYEGVEHAFDIHNYEQMSRKEHLYSNTNI